MNRYLFLFTVLVVGICIPVYSGEWPDLMPGDLILTRNQTARENVTPGYWNHVAIVGTSGMILEAQRMSDGVIETFPDVFQSRYPEWCVLRAVDKNQAFLAAQNAERRVGMSDYRYFSSVLPYLDEKGKNDNCVSLVRRAYLVATGIDYRWRRPDHLFYWQNRGHFRKLSIGSSILPQKKTVFSDRRKKMTAYTSPFFYENSLYFIYSL